MADLVAPSHSNMQFSKLPFEISPGTFGLEVVGAAERGLHEEHYGLSPESKAFVALQVPHLRDSLPKTSHGAYEKTGIIDARAKLVALTVGEDLSSIFTDDADFPPYLLAAHEDALAAMALKAKRARKPETKADAEVALERSQTFLGWLGHSATDLQVLNFM